MSSSLMVVGPSVVSGWVPKSRELRSWQGCAAVEGFRRTARARGTVTSMTLFVGYAAGRETQCVEFRFGKHPPALI